MSAAVLLGFWIWASTFPAAKLEILYGTPVYSVKLPSMAEENVELADVVEEAWKKFLATQPANLLENENRREELNEKFYDWHHMGLINVEDHRECLEKTAQSIAECEEQTLFASTSWPSLVKSNGFRKLLRWDGGLYWKHLRRFASLIGHPESDLQEMFDPRRMPSWHMWATRHADGVSHGEHGHTGSLFSGVYYVKVPKQNGTEGKLSFKDPKVMALMEWDGQSRGPSTKFVPEAGSLVLFPSYLRHRVNPTLGSDPRISIPVNVHWPDSHPQKIAVQTVGVTDVVGVFPSQLAMGARSPFELRLSSQFTSPEQLERNAFGLGPQKKTQLSDSEKMTTHRKFLNAIRKKTGLFKHASDEDATVIARFAKKYRMFQ